MLASISALQQRCIAFFSCSSAYRIPPHRSEIFSTNPDRYPSLLLSLCVFAVQPDKVVRETANNRSHYATIAEKKSEEWQKGVDREGRTGKLVEEKERKETFVEFQFADCFLQSLFRAGLLPLNQSTFERCANQSNPRRLIWMHDRDRWRRCLRSSRHPNDFKVTRAAQRPKEVYWYSQG